MLDENKNKLLTKYSKHFSQINVRWGQKEVYVLNIQNTSIKSMFDENKKKLRPQYSKHFSQIKY